jgi:hypothetical protein
LIVAKPDLRRFVVFRNGKWTGGSFASKEEADRAAPKFRKNADDKIEVSAKPVLGVQQSGK